MDIDAFLRENWSTLVGVAVMLFLFWAAWKILRPKKHVFGEGMTLNVRCRQCRWKGTVTKYNQVCSACNSPDLQKL